VFGLTLLIVLLAYAAALSWALSRAGHRADAEPAAGTPRRPPARILIVGATGGTGRELVAQALARGHEVTVLVRDPTRLRIQHARLKVVQGDVLDEVAVAAAMRGQEAVLSALGHRQFFRPTNILSEGTRNLLLAMEAEGVPRLVCETALGIGDSAGRLGLYYTFFTIPLILPFYFWDKTRQERLIAASQLDWVIVRPAVLTNGARRGACRHGRRMGNYFLTLRIPRADVAEFMLNQLTSDAYLRTAVGIAA
jgi:putative NADH-flavin reductase